jgi:hypothetical protein
MQTSCQKCYFWQQDQTTCHNSVTFIRCGGVQTRRSESFPSESSSESFSLSESCDSSTPDSTLPNCGASDSGFQASYSEPSSVHGCTILLHREDALGIALRRRTGHKTQCRLSELRPLSVPVSSPPDLITARRNSGIRKKMNLGTGLQGVKDRRGPVGMTATRKRGPRCSQPPLGGLTK